MVRIPRFEPQVAPAMEDQPFSSGDGYSAPGRAMQQLGQGLGSLGSGLDAWNKKAEAEAEKENSYLDQLNLFEKQREAQQVYDDFKVEKESDPDYNWQNFANEAKGRVGDVYGGFRPSSKAFAGPRGSLTIAKLTDPQRFHTDERAGKDRYVTGVVERNLQTEWTNFGVDVDKRGTAVPRPGELLRDEDVQPMTKEEYTQRFEAKINELDTILRGAPPQSRRALEVKAAALAKAELEARQGWELPAAKEMLERWLKGTPERALPSRERGASLIPRDATPETTQAVSSVASRVGVDPSAIAAVIQVESAWNPRNSTGRYNGLTQIGQETFTEAGGKLGGLTYQQYRNATPDQQIAVYGAWLDHYKFSEQMQKHGIDIAKLPPARQAAILQGFQFSPNGPEYKQGLARGDDNVPSSPIINGKRAKQADALGSTSIRDMEAHFTTLLGAGTPGASGNQQAGTRPSITPDLIGKPAPVVSKALAQASQPGVIHAVTDQEQRQFNAQGYGDKTTGAITVNGRTYEFVNGGTKRGSIPLGEYQIKRFTSGSQRAAEGFQYRKDAFELSDVADDAPGTQGQDKRRGLLIHDGNGGVTAGCVGIKGDFQQFKADLSAEIQKTGGPVKLNLMTRPTEAKMALGGPAPANNTIQGEQPTATDAPKNNVIPGERYAQAQVAPEARVAGSSQTQEMQVAQAMVPGELRSDEQGAGPSVAPDVGRGLHGIRGALSEMILKDKDQMGIRHLKHLEAEAARQRFEGFIGGTIPFNPYDDEDKKIVDKTFEAAKLGRKIFEGNPQAVGWTVAAAQKLNHIPKDVAQGFRGLVNAKEPVKRVLGYEAIQSILQRNPNGFEEGDDAKKLKSEAQDYSALRQSGKTVEESLLRIDEMKSPDWQKRSEAHKKTAEVNLKTFTVADIGKWFDTNYLPFTDPSVIDGPMALIKYQDSYKYHFTRSGDDTIAKFHAKAEIERVWGVSNIRGTKEVMQFPPERRYPQVWNPETKAYDHGYLARDIEMAVRQRSAGEKIAISDIQLKADSRTAAEIANEQPPSYHLSYWATDKDGTRRHVYVPGRWWLTGADIKNAQAAGEAKANEHRRKTLTEPPPTMLDRTLRERNREQMMGPR